MYSRQFVTVYEHCLLRLLKDFRSSMISVGQTTAIGYNPRFEEVFGTRGFNPLPCLNRRARG
jgi:hypothetical protein